MDPANRDAAMRVGKLVSTYEASRTLIEAGVYARGSSKDIDEAIDMRPAVLAFLGQKDDERVDLQRTRATLLALANGGQRT
jgi:flagellum-specific ATP synthase